MSKKWFRDFDKGLKDQMETYPQAGDSSPAPTGSRKPRVIKPTKKKKRMQ